MIHWTKSNQVLAVPVKNSKKIVYRKYRSYNGLVMNRICYKIERCMTKCGQSSVCKNLHLYWCGSPDGKAVEIGRLSLSIKTLAYAVSRLRTISMQHMNEEVWPHMEEAFRSVHAKSIKKIPRTSGKFRSIDEPSQW